MVSLARDQRQASPFNIQPVTGSIVYSRVASYEIYLVKRAQE